MAEHREITKAVPLHAIDLDANEGIVKGFPSVLGNWDLDGEMVPVGSFKKSIAQRADRIPMGLDHSLALGTTIHLEEVGRDDLPGAMKAAYPDALGGLYAEGRVSMMPDNIEWLEQEKRRIARGRPSGMSFTGRVLSTSKARMPNGREGLVLSEIMLKEWGPTPSLVHRNRAAQMLAVKAFDPDELADVDSLDLDDVIAVMLRRAEIETAIKAGATFSQKNAARLLSAWEQMGEMLKEAGLLPTADESTTEEGTAKAEASDADETPAQVADTALLIADSELRLAALKAQIIDMEAAYA